MEALLVGGWLLGDAPVAIVDEASVSVARERVREVGRAGGMPSDKVEAMVLVVSELGRNQLKHARGGVIDVRAVSRNGVGGLEIVAADRGAGLPDPAAALEGIPRSEGSLGVGLASVCSLADEVDFDVRVREGMCVVARKFAAEVPRWREIGVFGRAHVGERESGDGAAWVRDATGLSLAVCDGLGHGEQAKAASEAAMHAFLANASRPPAEVLEIAHGQLAKTRGAVMTVARITEDAGFVELAAVGNVGAGVFGARSARRFGGVSFVLGSTQQRLQKVRPESGPIGPRENLVVFSDGVRSQLALEEELVLLRERPIVLAQHVVERFGRDTDDVMVLVAR